MITKLVPNQKQVSEGSPMFRIAIFIPMPIVDRMANIRPTYLYRRTLLELLAKLSTSH